MTISAQKKAFANALFDGATKKQAAIDAGYSPNTASASGSRLAKDPDVIAYLERLKVVKDSGETVKPEKPTTTMAMINAADKLNDPLEFLKTVWMNAEEEMKHRIAAAGRALPYIHGKVADKGKKETKADDAKAAASGGGKFGTLDNQMTRPS